MAGMWMLIGGSVLSAVVSFAFLMSGASERVRQGAALLGVGALLQVLALVLVWMAGAAQ